MIKALLWDHQEFQEIELKNTDDKPMFEQVNELLDSRCMDALVLNDDLEIYCDDEGLLKPYPKFSIMWYNEKGRLIQGIGGKVIFVNHNEEGATISLTDEQIKLIKELPTKEIPDQINQTYKTLIVSYYSKD